VTQWPPPGPGPQWYLPSYPVPPLPPPPPRMRRGYLIGLVIGAVMVFVVCAGVAVGGVVWLGRPHAVAGTEPDPVLTTDGPQPAVTGTPSGGPTAGAAATPDGSARRYLLDPPAHATVVPSGDEVLTVAQVSDDTANDRRGELALLNDRGFAGGGTRSWVTDGGVTVLIDLLQFDTREQAGAYFAGEKTAVASNFTPQNRRAIPGMPDGVMYLGVGRFQSTAARTFSYAVRRNLVLFVRTSSEGDQISAAMTAAADDTALRQYRRLPA
jgi:hypothetical protein